MCEVMQDMRDNRLVAGKGSPGGGSASGCMYGQWCAVDGAAGSGPPVRAVGCAALRRSVALVTRVTLTCLSRHRADVCVLQCCVGHKQ